MATEKQKISGWSLGSLLVASVLFAATVSPAQTLPTGVAITPIYDTAKAGLSFRKDGISVAGMFEVPGKPKHFVVLGHFGFLYTLYPDTNAQGQIVDTVASFGTVHKYRRTQVADFMLEVMKGYEFGGTGITVDPEFKTNRRFYVSYNRYAATSEYGGLPLQANGTPTLRGATLEGPNNPGARSIVLRFVMSADHQTVSRDTTIVNELRATGYGSSNLRFGADGLLYIYTGAYNTASWDSTTPIRKILRIDVRTADPGKMYSIPPSNPWVNVPNPAVRKEVYAYGFRNTYSMAVNYLTGAIYASETGQTRWEEINRIRRNPNGTIRNYGWNRGGDASAYNANSDGIEGPCHETINGTRVMSNTATAGGYSRIDTNGTTVGNAAFRQPYKSITTGTPYDGTRTCADFTNPVWAFRDAGSDGLSSSLPAQTARVSSISPAFRGDSTSPFYGYHFITDIADRGFTAAKEGANPPLTRVGSALTTMGGMSFSGCGQHNGPTDFSEDSYGNIYVMYMSSSASGPCQNWDIYRLTHAELRPRATPRAQVWTAGCGPDDTNPNCGPVSVRQSSGRFRRGEGSMVNTAIAGLMLEIPTGYSGAAIYNAKGRLVWSYRGAETSVRVPSNLEMGILQVKYLR